MDIIIWPPLTRKKPNGLQCAKHSEFWVMSSKICGPSFIRLSWSCYLCLHFFSNMNKKFETNDHFQKLLIFEKFSRLEIDFAFNGCGFITSSLYKKNLTLKCNTIPKKTIMNKQSDRSLIGYVRLCLGPIFCLSARCIKHE